MQKLGAHSGTNDPEVDNKLLQVEQVNGHFIEMHDAVAEYIVAMQRLQAAQLKVSTVYETIVPIYTSDEDAKDINEEWSVRTKKLHDWYKEVMEPAQIETIIRPLGSKLQQIPSLKNKISVRQSKILDYDAYRSRMNAETAKNPDSENGLKLQTKLDRARESMNVATQDVMQGCQEIEEDNGGTILKVFSSFVACQAMMSERQAEEFKPLLEGLPNSADTMCRLCNDARTKDQDKMWGWGADATLHEGVGGADGVKKTTRESNVLNS